MLVYCILGCDNGCTACTAAGLTACSACSTGYFHDGSTTCTGKVAWCFIHYASEMVTSLNLNKYEHFWNFIKFC